MAKAIDGLRTWQDFDLLDLRNLTAEQRRPAMEEVEAGGGVKEAVAVLEHWMGFTNESMISVAIENQVLGVIHILRQNLEHIVEKRRDARERYVNLALDTIKEPYEIWLTPYDDDMCRYAFIGTYCQKYQMYVVIAPWNGRVLWNFMQAEAKSLNKHRRGKLLYFRK